MSQPAIVTTIFLATYALIVSERIHRTVVALAGAIIVIILGIMPQHQAFHAIDFNVIFLLVGMMVIASIMSETGIFQWIAVQSVRAGGGKPFAILIILAVVTAGASALLDNVTIVVLVAPVTLFVASNLRVSPVPFLVTEILASNIGGAATLIGDPPNILIGSAANIDFVQFAGNMAPIAAIGLLALLGITALRVRKELQITGDAVMTLPDPGELITDRPLLVKSLIVMSLVLIGFVLHGALHLEPATIALAGATLLLLITRKDPHPSLREVEWSTLFFFIGLFILVEALVQVGAITAVANQVLRLTAGDVRLTATLLLWLSALASGIVDNIPYTATMIPLVRSLGQSMAVEPLWWALAMGADFGGNLTLVGASANLVVATVAERAGHPISFGRFLTYSLLPTAIVLLLATAYLWLRYLF
jgi:Na+/H+ antiporter NhaD/arsenite permease-like protein